MINFKSSLLNCETPFFGSCRKIDNILVSVHQDTQFIFKANKIISVLFTHFFSLNFSNLVSPCISKRLIQIEENYSLAQNLTRSHTEYLTQKFLRLYEFKFKLVIFNHTAFLLTDTGIFKLLYHTFILLFFSQRFIDI
ncbi:hypothetical protein BpHYR1_011206 [Brachionus plicatilis]|uniref:Uncharacterized protein n=1 Tax=Brachionus plicatilis TaxID=10195 RepID=A0A3M7SN75_BRAPC|nr:hypothetical protein BpHYR1_011206 [Brachionus plicatilis]